jgi:hypothetical protein
MIAISLEKQLVKLRGLCQPYLDQAVTNCDQFNITRWATLINYFADLELAEIRKFKRQSIKAKTAFKQMELCVG